jgi:hypothetical protein
MHSRTTFLMLAVLCAALFPSRLSAQLTWEPANRGLEGAYFSGFFETPGGAMLATNWSRVYRRDPMSLEWERVLLDIGDNGAPSQFGVDSSGAIYGAAYPSAFRSTDDGATWTRVDSAFGLAEIDSRSVVLFGRSERSTDGGLTWTSSMPTNGWPVRSIGGGVLIGSYVDTLRISRDTGLTWQNLFQFPHWITSFVSIDSLHFIVATHMATYRTSDGGATWSLSHGSPGYDMVVMLNGDVVRASHSIYARIPTVGVYRTADSGQTWTKLTDAVAWGLGSARDGSIWGGFSYRPMRSTDNGATWQRVDGGLFERGGELMSSSDGTIYGTPWSVHLNVDNGGFGGIALVRTDDDGRTWKSLLDTLASVELIPGGWGMLATKVAHSPTNPYFAAITGTYLSTDRGDTWRMLASGGFGAHDGNASGMAAIPAAVDSTGNLLITTDRGATWTASLVPGRAGTVAVTPTGRIFSTSNDFIDNELESNLYRSDDTGRSWSIVLADLYVARMVAIDDDHIVAFGRPDSTTEFGIYLGRRNGTEWSRVLPAENIWQMIEDSTGGVMIVQGGNADGISLLWSADSGATWQRSIVPGSFGFSYATVTPRNEILCFAGNAIQRSVDHGKTWTTVDSSRKWTSAATNDRVMIASAETFYRTTAPSIVRLERQSDLASPLALMPVPAIDHVTVRTGGAAGTIRIIDARGVVVHEAQSDGRDALGIDVSALEPGAYVVELQSESGRHVGRFTVSR